MDKGTALIKVYEIIGNIRQISVVSLLPSHVRDRKRMW